MNTLSPVWNAAAISSIVSAIIALLVAFGVPLTEQQTAAILSFVAVAAPFVVALVVAPKVTPLANPTDEDGHPLSRAGSDAPTMKQTRSMLKK